jgi:hypothetical protein
MHDSQRQPSILCIGDDPRLLGSRAEVLLKLSRHVTISNFDGLTALLGKSFDLVVLCHTLTEARIARCTSVANSRWPEAKVVKIRTGWMSDLSMEDMEVSNHPRALQQGIQRILDQTKLTVTDGQPAQRRDPGENAA